MQITRRSDCRLCHSTNLKLVLQLEPSALANAFVSDLTIEQDKFPLDLFNCLDCGHYQLLDVVDPSILFKHYLYVSGTSKLMRRHFRNYACSVVSEFDLDDDDLLVEIGSNDGTSLKWFKTLGIKVLGIDPAENLAVKATQEGITTIPSFFNRKVANQIINEYGKASVVVANNVFAHADDLDEIVLGVKELLKENGVFIFEVSYFKDVILSGDFSQIYHEHTSYHTVLPLYSFFKKHDMQLYKIERVDSHGGSIRCFVSNKFDNNVLSSSHNDASFFIEQESKFGLYSINEPWSGVNKFIENIEKNKEDLNKLLIELKQSGKKISGVAASAKSTTFLHHYNIGTELLDYICDDAPEKIGLFSPGKHIPIVPFSKIYEDNPDYLLILSFNFVDSIITRHPNFKGKWIVPLPELKIIG